MTKPRLLVFTDLDGTLLDHDTYRWQAAEPALERLRQANIPVVLNSSKTASEMRGIRAALNNHHPFIVENGAAVVIPANCFGTVAEQVVNFGASREQVLSVLSGLRSEGYQFRGFADMSVDELRRLTGLSATSAELAKDRQGTEPVLWEGSDEELSTFTEKLAAANLRLVQGGRFFHVMGDFDKADGVRFLLGKYREHYGQEPLVTVALGDSPNDQRMLESVNIPVIIRGVQSDLVQLTSERHAMRSLKPGPEGWNECVLNILFEYGY
ncbi:HAD-IIB family hydrolase [Marinobacter sp. NP-4(2019)]|uniref:HAD-IIB family hydrolase n=1 Tax=Marinobacter sp. NP-4(2019) TaxID=2488665 RepID=UPI000FC3DDB3|nr:HAD-IIB family hydrolase [Marinobacter sp. NP-4(2019)]AZT83372.1 HAD-IIB family hydrolase [Marinobacter sp. NP-4(2019)]